MEKKLTCQTCGCGELKTSCGIINFACGGFYDPFSESYHKGGEACKIIAEFKSGSRVSVLKGPLEELIRWSISAGDALDSYSSVRGCREAETEAENLAKALNVQ